MIRFLLLSGLLIISALFLPSGAWAQNPPTLFFTDITSGPVTGGENVSGFAGAYVTLYGDFFGATPDITLNNAHCLRIVGSPTSFLWYQKQVVQLGAACTTGNFAVTSANGTSNPLPFTVRSGNIFFLSTTGNDAAAGTAAAPWKTLHKARDSTVAGDIVYLRTGTWNSSIDAEGSSSSIIMFAGTGGTSSAPKAMLNYPSETPTWSGAGKTYITYNWTGGQTHDWVFGGITMDGAHSTSRIIDGNNGYSNMRWVGN